MTLPRLAALALACAAFSPSESISQPAPRAAAPAPAGLGYADLADLAVAAPLAIDARIRSATRLTDGRATGVAAGRARYYVTADIVGLIRGAAGLPGRIDYVADVALDAKGKPPKLKKRRVLLLARPVAGKPGSVQLVAPDAQLDWDAATDARLRAILAEAVTPGAAPRVISVQSAFHTPGVVPGESETQIFLATASGQPISLSVLRRPGQQPRWAAALGEIVDEAAAAPKPDTLAWYRLACGLPAALPESSLEGVEPAQAAAARADYALVKAGLGSCGRTRDNK